MKAQFIFENYPPGAESDPNAPWNESDDSWVEFNSDHGDFVLRTMVQVSEDDVDSIDKETIDTDILLRYLSGKLGFNYEELEEIDLSSEFDIDDFNQKGDIVQFKTTIGDIEISLQELFSLARETRKKQAEWRLKNKDQE